MYIVSHTNKFRFTEITTSLWEGIKFRPQHLNLPVLQSKPAHNVFRPSTQKRPYYTVNKLIITHIEQFDSQSNPVSPTKQPMVLPTGFPTIGGTPLSVVPEVVPSTFPGSQQLWAAVGPTPSIPMSPLPEVPSTSRKLRITPSAPASPSLRCSKSKLSSGQTTPVFRRSVSLAEEMDDQPDFAPAAPARSPSRSSAEGNDKPPSLLRPELISDMVFHESIITSLKKQKTASSSVLASPDAIPDKLRSVANLLSNLVESLWVKEGDEVWNHEPLLEEYWNLLESEVREDVHNGCNPEDVENDKSAISVITRLIGRLNYLWAGIVSNDEDHLEVMLPQSITQIAITRMVLKQQRRIDHLEGELDFQRTIKDFLGMHRQDAVQFQDAFSYLLKGIVTMNDNFTMLSNDVEREVNRTLQAVRSTNTNYSNVSNSTTRTPTTTGTGKRKLDSSSFVDTQGNIIAPPGSKRTKNNAGQAVEQSAPASSNTVPTHLTNEQIAKAVPLVVATKDAPTPLSYEQALALIEQFDIVPKGRRIDPTAPTTTVIPSQEDVPRGGLQTTLDGGLYSAKATKATTAKFNATANPKSAMSKAKERATHLQAPKESTKLLRVIYDGGEANDSAKGLTLQQVQGYVEDLLRRLGLQANPVLALRWTQPYLLDITFTQRPSDVLQDALSTRAVWFLNLPANESIDKYTWPIVDYYIPTALLTIKQVSILTNVGTIVSTAEVYQELVGRNDFLSENILAFEQSPKLTIGKPTGDKADVSFAVLDSPKGMVEGSPFGLSMIHQT